jgi:hypothetical protein
MHVWLFHLSRYDEWIAIKMSDHCGFPLDPALKRVFFVHQLKSAFNYSVVPLWMWIKKL